MIPFFSPKFNFIAKVIQMFNNFWSKVFFKNSTSTSATWEKLAIFITTSGHTDSVCVFLCMCFSSKVQVVFSSKSDCPTWPDLLLKKPLPLFSLSHLILNLYLLLYNVVHLCLYFFLFQKHFEQFSANICRCLLIRFSRMRFCSEFSLDSPLP